MGQKTSTNAKKKSQATITLPANNAFEAQGQPKQSIGGTKTHNSRNNTAKRQQKQQQNNNHKNSSQKTKKTNQKQQSKKQSQDIVFIYPQSKRKQQSNNTNVTQTCNTYHRPTFDVTQRQTRKTTKNCLPSPPGVSDVQFLQFRKTVGQSIADWSVQQLSEISGFICSNADE